MFGKKQEGLPEGAAPAPVLTSPSRSYLWAMLIVVVVVLVAAGGAFAYFKYIANDELVFEKALKNTDQIKSFEYSGEVKVTGSSPRATALASSFLGGAGRDLGVLIEFKGSSDVTDIMKPKTKIKVDATLMDPNQPISTSVEVITIGEVNYLNLEGLATTIMTALGKNERAGAFLSGLDLRPVQENWIKLDKEALRNKLGLSELYEKKLKEAEAKKLTKEQIETLRRSIYEDKVVKVVAKLGKQTIDGVETKGFKIAFEKEGLKKFLAKLEQVTGEKVPENLAKKLESAPSDSSNIDIRVWLDKNAYLRKISISSNQIDSSGAATKVSIDIFFKNYNQPVSIEAPNKTIDLNQLIEQIMGEYGLKDRYSTSSFDYASSSLYYTSSTTSAMDIDSDKDGLTDYEEAFYGTNPKKADSDGDGFKDGEEVAGGYNPLGPGKLDIAKLKTLRNKGYE